MSLSVVDSILLSRLPGHVIWVPRLSTFIGLAFAVALMPGLFSGSVVLLCLCAVRIFTKNNIIAKLVVLASQASGKPTKYFNQALMGSEVARKVVAEKLHGQVRITQVRGGRGVKMKIVPLSPAANEAAALALAVIQWHGDANQVIWNQNGISLTLRNSDASRMDEYDLLLTELLGTDVVCFVRCLFVSEEDDTPKKVVKKEDGLYTATALLSIGEGHRLKLARTLKGVSLQSCYEHQMGEVLVYPDVRPLLKTWGHLLDEKQREIVLQVGRTPLAVVQAALSEESPA